MKAKLQKVVMIALSLMWIRGDVSEAQFLPTMDKQPWVGYFSGYKRNSFEFGMNVEAEGWLYLKNSKRERVGRNRAVKVYAEVHVELPNGKYLYKKLLDNEGLETDMKPSLKHKEVIVRAMTNDNARVEIKYQYNGNKIIMDGRVLDRGDLPKGKIFFVYKVKVPPMYTSAYKNFKKAKTRMKKDKIRFVRAQDGKKVTLASYKPVDLADEKNAKKGVTFLEVSMDGQEGEKFVFTTKDRKGVLRFENRYKNKKGELWKGYYVKWRREMGDEKASPFVLEVK